MPPLPAFREMARFPAMTASRSTSVSRTPSTGSAGCTLHSFRVDVSGSNQGLGHSHYTALKSKTPWSSSRDLWGERSSIDLEEPDLSLHVHLNRQEARLSLDGSGGSLHRRGYRSAMGLAPLKENLAAGLVRLSGWDGTTPLVDPLCGSGTLLIEATSWALSQAPGLHRPFALEGWADFNAELWEEEQQRAQAREQPLSTLPVLLGCEENAHVADQARHNVQAAGLDEAITIQTGDFRTLELPSGPGVLVCNPPYERIGELTTRAALRRSGGDGEGALQRLEPWLPSELELTGALRMKASRRIPVSNGGMIAAGSSEIR